MNNSLSYQIGKVSGEGRSCTGKINYRGELRAWEAALQMFNKTGKKFKAYKCAFCHGGWHIAHKH
jgi:hypothetical protein